MQSNGYMRVLLRFWWVLLLGVLIGSAVAVLAVNRVELGLPPKLVPRASKTYSAGARMLVTSQERPYFRISIAKSIATVPTTTGTEAGASQETVVDSRPDFSTMINAANLYPLLIESDQVALVRNELIGPIPGVVTAQAVYSVNNPGRYVPSRVPVIQIVAASNTPANAVKLAQGTVDAFDTWIGREQDAAKLRQDERVLIQQIQAPQSVLASGGTSMSLPLLAFMAVVVASGALAFVLGKLFPVEPERARMIVDSLNRRAATSQQT